MNSAALLLILAVLTYFIGSIPFGLIVGKAKGIDPRTAGTGNIGATNLGRLLGGKYFALVFTLDLLKSMIPMAIASAIVYHEAHDWLLYLLWLLIGFAAIIGHMYSVFLKFKGGKGVATGAGVMLGLFPYYTLPAFLGIATFLAVFFIWRYISLASIAGAGSFPVYFVTVGLLRGWPVFEEQLPILLFAVLMGGLIIYKHRSNIARLRNGTEPRFVRQAGA